MNRTRVAVVALALFAGSSAGADDVTWTSATGVTATGNDLQKTSGTAAWNAGAISTAQFGWGPVYVEFTAAETNTLRLCGLSKGNPGATNGEIDFGIEVNASGNYQAYEGGSWRGTAAAYSPGDRFRVEAEPGTVRYLRNGTVFYTSLLVVNFPLLVDTSLNTVGATINDVTVGTLVFTQASGVTVAGSTLTKTGAAGWTSGASSAARLETGDGFVDFTAAETTTSRALGLSRGDGSVDLEDLDFGVHLKADGTFQAIENGTYQGSSASYSTSDVFRIEVLSGTVRYKLNGVTFQTSSGTPAYPLVVDTALESVGATLTDVKFITLLWSGATNVTVTGTSLVKAASAGWNGGAVSTASLSGDAWMEFTAVETNTDRVAGLSNGDSNQADTDVDFGIWLKSDATVGVLEAGTDRGAFGSYAFMDRFRVEVADGAVKYRKNGVVFYSSTVTPTSPLLIDTSLDEVGATLSNVSLGTLVWKSDTAVAVNGASLQKTAATAAWDAGAVATATIASGVSAAVEFTVGETATRRAIGLSHGNPGTTYTEIDYAIHLETTGAGTVYENGTSRATIASYAPGDRFAVEVASGIVRYYQNGLLLYTSGVTPTYPLLVDTGAYSADATLVNVSLGGVITPRVATPTFSPVGGTYTGAQAVAISCATSGATIRYTTDGSEPSVTSTTYSGAINVATTTTVKARAWKTGYDASLAGSATYQMSFGTLAAPTFDPTGGTYTSSVAVTMSSTQSGATIRYTTNGSEPTASSTVYGAPLVLSTTTTLKAKAFHIDYTTSAATAATYTIEVATPTFSPDGGSHAAGATITIATATSGATIRYTLNGAEPSASDPVIASGGTLVVGNYTLTAKAWKTGCTTSATKSADYTMTGVFTEGMVVAGDYHTLALKHDGTVWAWGDNAPGKLGDGTTIAAARPVRVAGLTGVTMIAACSFSSMALRHDGTVWTWGRDNAGELGNGAAGNTPWPTQILSGVSHIAAGDTHALACKTDGTVVAWGFNGSGRLGDGTTTNRTAPVAVVDLAGAVAVAAGSDHSVALLADGTVRAWGENLYNRLGDGTTTARWTPVRVDGLSGITKIAVGARHSLALRDDGRVFAWGKNTFGELGDSTSIERSTPAMALIQDVTHIGAAYDASFARQSNGTLWSWGSDAWAVLGDGAPNSGNVKTPTQVASVPAISAIGAGISSQAFALTSDRRVLAWGANTAGFIHNRIGDGTKITRTSPVEISAADFEWKVATPRLTMGGFAYGELQTLNVTTSQSVTIATDTPGATVYYTTNGMDPTASDTEVSGPVVIDDNKTLKARAYKSGLPASNVDGVILAYKVATPAFNPVGGTSTEYTVAQDVTISCATAGVTIRYTTDGSEPTTSSTLYSGAITLATRATLKAKAFKAGWTDSDIRTAEYVFDYGAAAPPTIAPAAGAYVDSVTVTMSGPAGATVRYRTGGGDPGSTSPAYTGPIVLTAGTTVKARSYHPDYAVPSAVVTRVYDIELAAPTLSPSGGTYSYGQAVTASASTAGATLRYTLGGTDPTENDPEIASGTVLALVGSETIKLKVFKAGFLDSAVTSATYTITGSGTTYAVVAAGRGNSSYALRSADSSLWAWGENGFRQLGDGATTDRASPTSITGFGTVASIAGGTSHTIARRADGLVYAAGLNSTGELGDGTTSVRTNPVQVLNLSDVTAVAAGSNHGLAVSGGAVFGWGANTKGQLGNGTVTSAQSTRVATHTLTSGVVAVAAGLLHSAALKSDGTVWAWGDDQFGQLGDGGTWVNSSTPVQVTGITTAIAIAAGEYHTLALLADGTVRAWGSGAGGKLGNGSTTHQFGPVTVTGLAGVRSIAAGSSHNVAARSDGSVVVWGDGAWARLGVPGVAATSYPIFVPGPSGIVQVAAGSRHTLALAGDGTLWAWGTNSSHQVGDGSSVVRTAPVKIADASLAWKTATPTFDIAAGTYNAERTVALGCTTAGALIHYTTNGADPAATDPSVSPGGTVAITSSATLKARAFASGLAASNVASAAYTLQVPAPAFSLANGTYNTDQSLTLSTGTVTGTTIRYTTDGSAPAETSTAYTGALTVADSRMIKAKAWRTGWTASIDPSGIYTMKVATATVSPGAGSYTSPQTVTVAASTAGATLHYTLDGREPTESSPIIASGGTIVIGESAALAVRGWRTGWTPGDVKWAFYSIGLGTVTTPTISPAAGTYTSVQAVTLSGTVGATLRYTTDGTEPTFTSRLYTGPFTVDAAMTVKAKAFQEDHTPSATASAAYTIDLAGTVAPVTFSPPPGSYSTARTVTMTTATGGATIHYTTNGMDPTTSDLSVASGGTVVIDRHLPLKARAFLTGSTPSPIRRAEYQITGAIAAGTAHGLSVKTDGTVWCFGANGTGQLGNGTTTNSSTPVPASGLTSAVAVAGGGDSGWGHSLAVKSDGTVMAWGRNGSGQIGDGSTTTRTTPAAVTAVAGFNSIVAVAAGRDHSLALKSDGTVWAWGGNSRGQVGDGSTTARTTPVLVGGLTDVIAIAAGDLHSVALTRDGSVRAWGYNAYGALGDGTLTQRLTPVPVTGMTGVVAIAAGGHHTRLLKTDGAETGSMWAWGDNSTGGSGALGTGSAGNVPTPVRVLSNVTAVASSLTMGLGLTADGRLRGLVATGMHNGYTIPDPITGVGGIVSATTFFVTLATDRFVTIAAGHPIGIALLWDTSLFTWSSGRPGHGFVLGLGGAAGDDPDGDGLTTGEEWSLGTDPWSADTNGDGISDGEAISTGRSATNPDMDGDGVPNAVERANGTDPFRSDTDNDTVGDAADCFPLDSTRSTCPSPTPGDTTAPTITLAEPTNAVLVP